MVGQAGKPKTITGFQTHTTPVLLAYGERAELATEECILNPSYLKTEEGFFVCVYGGGGWVRKFLTVVALKNAESFLTTLALEGRL